MSCPASLNMGSRGRGESRRRIFREERYANASIQSRIKQRKHDILHSNFGLQSTQWSRFPWYNITKLYITSRGNRMIQNRLQVITKVAHKLVDERMIWWASWLTITVARPGSGSTPGLAPTAGLRRAGLLPDLDYKPGLLEQPNECSESAIEACVYTTVWCNECGVIFNKQWVRAVISK